MTPITTKIHVNEKPLNFDCKNDKSSTKYGSILNIKKEDLILNSYETIAIHFSTFNTMWGTYNHFLEIEVEGIDQVYEIPLKINVVGSPVKIFLSKQPDEEVSLIR